MFDGSKRVKNAINDLEIRLQQSNSVQQSPNFTTGAPSPGSVRHASAASEPYRSAWEMTSQVSRKSFDYSSTSKQQLNQSRSYESVGHSRSSLSSFDRSNSLDSSNRAPSFESNFDQSRSYESVDQPRHVFEPAPPLESAGSSHSGRVASSSTDDVRQFTHPGLPGQVSSPTPCGILCGIVICGAGVSKSSPCHWNAEHKKLSGNGRVGKRGGGRKCLCAVCVCVNGVRLPFSASRRKIGSSKSSCQRK